MAIQDKSLVYGNIPQPPTKPLVGNFTDITAGMAVQSMMQLTRQYGPIFRLEVPGRKLVLVSGPELVAELCDEKRFDKKVWRPLQQVRNFAGDGLFTSWTQEPNWKKAHNILLPNFSQRAMQGYHPMMLDIAQQMMHKWERLNSDDEIDVPGDMTRLTLDTIGLCGFDYRFNSFYRQDQHPFVKAMVEALGKSMERVQRLPLQDKLQVQKHRQFQANVDYLNKVVDTVIQERKAAGVEKGQHDLLYHMLTGQDKQSGEGLDDVNIRYQIITFLIAGHETTSGLLSFAVYYLLQHPEVLAKAYEEVDRVLGTDTNILPTFQQVNRLQYVMQILKETLRLWPTAPAFALYPYEDTVIGGQYRVDRTHEWVVLIPMLHRDKSVWGDDAEKFNPDHFSHEAEANRPASAYKPFGNGERACIGRQFAMQEATLVMGMLLQRFKLIDHTNYQLQVKETLTLKPEHFSIKVRKRGVSDYSVTPTKVEVAHTQTPSLVENKPAPVPSGVKKHHTPLLVLYGSNLGTAEDLAHKLREDGTAYGFDAQVANLDDYVEKLPTSGAVIVVSASYNGQPPDNAVKFCEWVKDPQLASNALRGVNYTVFGCGNREWAATYQAIPKLLDTGLANHGATLVYPRGEGDASDDFEGQFTAWYTDFWTKLAESLKIDLGDISASTWGPLLEVEVLAGGKTSNPFAASYGAVEMKVLENRELQSKDGLYPSERSTRHIALELPAGMKYRAGDHLGVLPRNGDAQVQRVLTHFGFDHETRVLLHKSDERKTNLPIDEPVIVADLLQNYVELQEPTSRSQIRAMLASTECPPDQKRFQKMLEDDATYRTEVLSKRKSLIDLLEEFPACTMPFNLYLEALIPLRPRYYSISSSPLASPQECSITVSVVRSPALSGHGEYCGVASYYTAQLQPGDNILAFVRDTKETFRLPADSRTPIVMVGPGTGLAPFRGFLQERAQRRSMGEEVGPALLFFGCRHPEQDYLYEQELKHFAEEGVVNLFTAFSRVQDQKEYVQDVIAQQQDTVWELLQNGAMVYICGDGSNMAPAVRQTFGEIYWQKSGASQPEAEQWLDKMSQEGRYLVDVWSGNSPSGWSHLIPSVLTPGCIINSMMISQGISRKLAWLRSANSKCVVSKIARRRLARSKQDWTQDALVRLASCRSAFIRSLV